MSHHIFHMVSDLYATRKLCPFARIKSRRETKRLLLFYSGCTLPTLYR
ncbi:hypothetical protein POX_d05200 [Penicillium oxalicum]|nr:hypothetical protein POX_d05200 [Penicillium oxalicum]KAI2789703.1 hypothetical protein POX_d05200 [Penicillium oxalicum]